ncbi:hypothetical protein [Streptomyces sp. Ncost-T10-10d]|uniref:hypothetical protein n=1 Tax=Streptomyces sp. Ncost-T10-10d TaxID=1839774 RepID=UPI00114CD12B|nr:hypothetical protein [Streptomyces sp. Ncost-T10-10d]
MAGRADPGVAPQTHPDLPAWLTERVQSFEHWAEATGTPETWDFSPQSLDTLEGLIRSRCNGDTESLAARRDAFLQGACWYIGEVVCRAQGAVWKFEPFAVKGAELPSLFGEADPSGVVDDPCVGVPGEDTEEAIYPMGAVHGLFSTEDELGNPTTQRLSDLLGDSDEYDEEEQ